ncbi:hypothetical protein C4J81_11935 [Deltaproteobacteria bacterium Smac51]|nr:hypothetical protein C4J81_11935 [Deltaproteobacteria bacterium Smac51]
MLEFMRKNAGSKLVWLIIGAISLVFIFFGVGSHGGGGQLITVNGEEISQRDFRDMADRIARSSPAGSGDSDRTARDKAVRDTTIMVLVRQTLVNQFGRNVGLEPTDRAVARSIYNMAEFMGEDGKFSKERYEAALGRTSVAAFENSTRRTITISRANALIGSLSQVYQPEALEMYHFEADKMKFDFLFFPSDKYKNGLSASDEALNDFYALNREQWRLPATMKVEYIDIDPADFIEQAQVSEEEVKTAYSEGAESFMRPETAEVSHILFKFPQMNPTDEEKEETLARARSAFSNATADNFAELARELSDDPGTASEGGGLGQINSDRQLLNVTAAVMALPLNTVSEPMETPLGYHLFIVTGREEARPLTFEEIKDTLEAGLKADKARRLAVSLLEDLIERSETNPNLADVAKSVGLETEVSAPFSLDNPPDFFEGNYVAVQRAFQAEVGRVAAPVEERDHLALFTPLERTESHIPPLEEVRESVLAAWTDYEAGRLARLEAAAFIKKAGEEGWANAAAGLEDVRGGQSELMSRQELMNSIPLLFTQSAELEAAINSVAAPGQISPVPVLGNYEGLDGCFALNLADFEPAADNGFSSGSIMVRETARRADVMYEVWLDELVKASAANIYIPTMYTN